jgi:glycosyltransferase involved in cell wall biosynthesis
LVFFTWANIYVPLRPRFLSLFERYNLSHSDWAIVGNRDAGEILRQRGFRRPISVIPQLGVDLDLFTPGDGNSLRKKLGLTLETFVIGFASRMVPEKGPELLVEAVSHLAGNWSLLLIGKGPARAEVLRRAEQLGIREKLCLVDNVPHLEFVHYLRAMDVLVLPSVSTPMWKEQYAGGLLQAMACKIPAVGSTCGEIPNVLGDAGMIFRENDVAALIRCLSDLHTQPSLRAALIQRGFNRVQQYSWEAIAQQTYAVWVRLLSQGFSKFRNNGKN